MTESYVCPTCERVEERSYRVRFIILTCPDCGENGRFIHTSFVDRLEEIPESEHPEGWADMTLDERLLYAVREGLLQIDITGPM
ncbi:MAG: hypothetical protein ABEI27_05835 [Halobellus sp.]|uniref:hypothetical protein n=1 Tax=Halobellus sp. TaxID=1979212 RepID=UPI0035D4F77A